MKKKLEYWKRKLKDFVKKHGILYGIVYGLSFLVWGVWCVVRAKFIFSKIKHSSAKTDFRVIVHAVRTIPSTNLVYFDAIFGHAFRKLGCDVKMLYCDGVLDSCDADTICLNQKPQCFACKKLGPFLRNSLGLGYFSYRQYISESEIEEIKKKVANLDDKELSSYQYLGVNVGSHAKASAVRFFLSGKIDLSNPKEVAILRKKLVYAMITTKIANEVYLKENPKLIFTLHGIYSTWGPFFDYFRTKDINVIVYVNPPVRFGASLFNRNGREWDFVTKKTWDGLKKKSLSQEEESQIDNYLSARFKGILADQLLYGKNFDNAESGKKSEVESLFNKKYRRHYVLYPNLAWDACVERQTSTVFGDIFSWVDASIDYFKEKPNYHLIIKPHPAELIWEKGTKSITNHIFSKYPNLPENITVLKPDTSLRAYDLINPESICLTFNGTIGLELATQGIPVLVVGDIHYKEAGAVYKIETREKYLSLLDNPEEVISFAKNNLELAKKYAYLYFLKQLVRVPFYRDDEWSMIDWRVVRDTDNLFSGESTVMKICKKIIKGEEVVSPL